MQSLFQQLTIVIFGIFLKQSDSLLTIKILGKTRGVSHLLIVIIFYDANLYSEYILKASREIISISKDKRHRDIEPEKN